MNKKQLFIFAIAILLIFSAIAITIAKRSSTLSPQQEAFKSYFEEKMLKLPQSQQTQLDNLQKSSSLDKLLSSPAQETQQPKVQKQQPQIK